MWFHCIQGKQDKLATQVYSVIDILPLIVVINLKCPKRDRSCLCNSLREQRAVEDSTSQQSLRKAERQSPECKMHRSFIALRELFMVTQTVFSHDRQTAAAR